MKEQIRAIVKALQVAGISLPEASSQFKKLWIEEVLKKHHYNRCHAAMELEMHRNTLRLAIEELGIELPPRKNVMKEKLLAPYSIKEQA